MGYDLIFREIAAQQAAANFRFDSNDNLNREVIAAIANVLTQQNVNSITDLVLSLGDDVYVYQGYDQINKGAETVVQNQGVKILGADNTRAGTEYDFIQVADKDAFITYFSKNADAIYYIKIKNTVSGLIYFYVLSKYPISHTSAWKDFTNVIVNSLPGISLILSIALPGAGLLLGQSIGGVVGITDTVLCKMIGNVAVSTVLSGGNLEKSLQSAALSYAGIVGSDQLGSVTGYPQLSAIAGAGAVAAIKGGNVVTALISAGANAGLHMDNYIDSTDLSGDYVSVIEPSITIDNTFNNLPTITGDAMSGDVSSTDEYGNETITHADGSFDVYNHDGSVYQLDAEGNIIASSIYGNNGSNSGNSSTGNVDNSGNGNSSANINFNDIISKLPTLINLWNSVGKPNVRNATSVNSAGSTVTANRNGTLTTVSRTGGVTVTKMPVGVPYQLPGGSYVVTDAAGNAIVTDPSGNVSISKIPDTTGSAGNSGALVIAGIALLLMGEK